MAGGAFVRVPVRNRCDSVLIRDARAATIAPMSIEAHVRHRSGGKRAPRSVDGLIAAWAERQHGVVTRAQLVADGVGRRAIDRRIAAGLLRPLHRGVFAVGHPALRPEAWWIAAVLARSGARAGRGGGRAERRGGRGAPGAHGALHVAGDPLVRAADVERRLVGPV